MTAREIAAQYLDWASHRSGDGVRHWQPHSKALVYQFMLAQCAETDALRAELAALRAELAPEGPVLLARKCAEVEVLEQRINALMTGECPV